MKLPEVAFHSVDSALIPEDIKRLPRASRRLMEILLKGSDAFPENCLKSWSLDFCLSPKAFEADPRDSSRVHSTTFERTTLSSPFEPSAYAVATGETTRLPSSAVFRSIGYKSVALDGFSELGVPFDERRGIIQNDGLGRVQREVRTQDGAMAHGNFPGLYCAGWVKRGPTGVIASTMTDAFATADAIAEDWEARTSFLPSGVEEKMPPGWEGIKSLTASGNKAPFVRWEDWQRIDAVERDRGGRVGKEREKLTSTADMLNIIG